MSYTITDPSQWPEAPYYVTAVDTFLSDDYGESGPKTNVVVLPCRDEAEANIVKANVENRGEMEHVRISSAPPGLSPNVKHDILDREHAPRWFEPGGFQREDLSRVEYNGWTNKATWAMSLHLNNDRVMYDYAISIIRSTKDEAAQERKLREYGSHLHKTNDLLRSDFKGLDLEHVNWAEVADGFREVVRDCGQGLGY